VPFVLPERAEGGVWTVEVSTANDEDLRQPLKAGEAITMVARSVLLLR
jgi:hypothetical protein